MAKASSDARKRANAKYDAAHTVQFKMKLNTTTDADVLKRLGEVENKQGYVKDLIRDDIRKSRKSHKVTE